MAAIWELMSERLNRSDRAMHALDKADRSWVQFTVRDTARVRRARTFFARSRLGGL